MTEPTHVMIVAALDSFLPNWREERTDWRAKTIEDMRAALRAALAVKPRTDA